MGKSLLSRTEEAHCCYVFYLARPNKFATISFGVEMNLYFTVCLRLWPLHRMLSFVEGRDIALTVPRIKPHTLSRIAPFLCATSTKSLVLTNKIIKPRLV